MTRKGATPFPTPIKGLDGELFNLIIPSQISYSKAYKHFAKKNLNTLITSYHHFRGDSQL